MDHFTPLPTMAISPSARICEPNPVDAPVSPDSPALLVMTDLTQVPAATIQPQVSMDEAHEFMQHRGVRLLFVLQPGGALAGLVTATDILGEKPVRLVQNQRIKHSDITVADLMTPVDRIEALDFQAVKRARVGNIVASLRAAGRQHALVVESDGASKSWIRGIYSLSQIARQLGTPIQLPEAASSFAEIEAVLGPET